MKRTSALCLPFCLTLVAGLAIAATAQPAAPPATAPPATEKPAIEQSAIERFGAAARTYAALKSLRVRWRETSALGIESIWELRWRKISAENAQVWVRGFDPRSKLTNTFVYDGKRFLHLRTDENELESQTLTPSAGTEKVLTASPTVFLSWVPLLAGVNFAADKDKVVGARTENGRVVLDAQLPATTGLTKLTYGFDDADLLKDFSVTRALGADKVGVTLRWQVQKQEPNVALSDADFVLKAPPKPVKAPVPKLSLQIDPRAVAAFERAARRYGGLKSWSASVQGATDGSKDAPVEIDLVKPNRLRVLAKSGLTVGHFVNAGKHWLLDPEAKTYQQESEEMTGPDPATQILGRWGAIEREVGQWMLGVNPLSAARAPQFYKGSISVVAKQLADAKLSNQLCERVGITTRDPAEPPLAATTIAKTFWIRKSDSAILRVEKRFAEQGETPFVSTEDYAQRFNPSLPASRFAFSPPPGYKKTDSIFQ